MALQTITSIDQLLLDIELGSGYDGYLSIIQNLNITKEQVSHLCKWNEDHYSRNVLFRGGSVEVLLMCWEPGQESLIHSYDNQEGWIYAVDGDLTIDHYFESKSEKKMEAFKSISIDKGRYLYLNDYLGFHSVKNVSNKRAISIHIHAGPVLSWKVYDPKTNAFYNLHPN